MPMVSMYTPLLGVPSTTASLNSLLLSAIFTFCSYVFFSLCIDCSLCKREALAAARGQGESLGRVAY